MQQVPQDQLRKVAEDLEGKRQRLLSLWEVRIRKAQFLAESNLCSWSPDRSVLPRDNFGRIDKRKIGVPSRCRIRQSA